MTEEFTKKLLSTMGQLAFTTGNTSIKREVLGLLEDLVVPGKESLSNRQTLIQAIRPFVLDWDRLIRSQAFRILRLILPGNEDIFQRLSLHFLTFIRLESSKSVQERASILRFIAKWLSISTDSGLVESIVRSLTEISVAHTGGLSSNATDFYSAIFAMLLDASKRFPEETLKFLNRIANTCSSRLDNATYGILLDRIVHSCGVVGFSVQVLPDVLSTRAIMKLSKSLAGISMLAHSLTANKVCDEATTFLEIFGEDFSEKSSFVQMLREVPDVGPILLHSAQKSMTSNASTTSTELDLLCAIEPPGLIDYLNTVSWRFPDWIAQKFRDRILVFQDHPQSATSWLPLQPFVVASRARRFPPLDPEREVVLKDILELLSSVQFKTRSANLTSKRQQNPALFQSPQLWSAVYGYTFSGSFNLQSRRVIHGLLVHAVCSSADLEVVDSLHHS